MRTIRAIYYCFSSIKMMVVLSCGLIFFYLMGVALPQDGDYDKYAKAGGKLFGLVKALDLLNAFTSPLFLIVAALFFASLLLNTIKRILLWANMRGPGGDLFQLEESRKAGNCHSIEFHAGSSFENEVRDALKTMGFCLKELGPSVFTAQKGAPGFWLSWLTHAAFIVLMVGVGISYLFSFTGSIALFAGEPATISKDSPDQRWNKLTARLGLKGGSMEALKGRTFQLESRSFKTELTPAKSLTYPEKKEDRLSYALAVALGLEKERFGYKILGDKYSYKDWKTDLVVYDRGSKVKEKLIEVNDPLSYENITFYQAYFEQEFDLEFDGKVRRKATVGNEFTIDGVNSKFKAEQMYIGTLFGADGTVKQIKPILILRASAADAGAKPDKERFKVSLVEGVPGEFLGGKIVATNFREATGLIYRYDPAIALLWIAALILMVTMTLRLWGYHYKLICRMDGDRLDFLLRCEGLFASKRAILRQIRDRFERPQLK